MDGDGQGPREFRAAWKVRMLEMFGCLAVLRSAFGISQDEAF